MYLFYLVVLLIDHQLIFSCQIITSRTLDHIRACNSRTVCPARFA